MYNTKVFKTAPTSWSRGVRGAEAAGRQAQQGPRAGLRRPDLHRRRRAVPDGEEAGARHQGSVRAQRSSSTPPRSTLLRKQHPLVQRYWHDANVQVQDFTERRHRRLELVAVPGRTRCVANKQPIASTVPGGRRHRLGRHHDARTRTPSIRTAPTSGWSGRSRRRCRVMSPRGSARCPRCRRPARGNALLGAEAARPTASTTSTRSSSGARRKRAARRRATLRAVQPLGDRLRRGDGRPLTRRPGGSAIGCTARMTAAIEFRDVSRAFGDVRAVDRVSLDDRSPASSSRCSGPSGSGKTTCLRLIAGFDSPTAGRCCSTARTSPTCRRTSATSTPCSRTTRCFRT